MNKKGVTMMNLMKRFNKIVPLLLALALFFSGCGGSDEEQQPGVTTITFFTMQLRPTFDEYFQNIFDEFEKTHPDVNIEWQDYPAQDYDTKLLTSYMGDDPPDVINLTAQMVPKFTNRNLLLDLETVLPQETIDSYFQNVVDDACTVGDAVYALPWYLATSVGMVNMAIFREAGLTEEDIPETYEELWDVAEIIRDKTDKYAFFPIYTEAGALRGHLIDAGVDILNDDETKAIFNTPKAVEVFKFWADYYKEDLAPSEALTAMHRRPIELFKSGRLAIFQSGPQFLKHVKSDAPDVYKNTVIIPRLHWEGKEIYTIDVHNVAVSDRAEDKDLAAEFAAFVTNGANQLEFAKLTTIIPSVKSAVEDPYFTNVEDTPKGKSRKIAAQVIKKGVVVRTPKKHSGKLFRVMDQVMEDVCLGEMTPEEGLKYAEDKWNEILQD